jgi:hypothetical protein
LPSLNVELWLSQKSWNANLLVYQRRGHGERRKGAKMGFWAGLLLGLFIGANVGVVVVALLVAAAKGEPELVMEAE